MKFMRVIGLAGLLCAGSIWLAPQASAHVLRTDKGIGVELHVPPLDEPKSGEPTRLLFNFEEQPAGFIVADCDCKVRVQSVKTGNQVVGGTLTPTDDGLQGVVTFPEGGSYSMRLNGFTASNHQETFSVAYTVSVAQGLKRANNLAQVVILILVGLSVTATGVAIWWLYLRPGRKQSDN